MLTEGIEKIANNHHYQTVWLLRRAVYLVIGFYFLRLLPFADTFFAPDAFIHYYHFDGNSSKWIVQALNFELLHAIYPLLLGPLFAFLILGLWGKWQTFSAVGVYLCTIILQYKTINITNGGEQLLYNILFWMIFLNEKEEGTVQRNLISWFGLVAVKFEVVLLYFTAGFGKLTGTHWLSGDAFFLVSQIPEYSNIWMAKFIVEHPNIGYFLNYYTLIYQIGFPFFIWFRKLKYKWMTLGVLFHLGIGFTCGIMDFGLILLAAYFAFYDEDRSEWVKSALLKIKNAGYNTIKAKGD